MQTSYEHSIHNYYFEFISIHTYIHTYIHPTKIHKAHSKKTKQRIMEALDLSNNSQLERERHEAVLLELEARKRSHTISVPTLHKDVCRII